ncbi:1614_t:CDS:2, partial [Paraglomus brasilianum]
TLCTKHKLLPEVEDGGTVPVLVYGVVTSALQWVFLCWGGSSNKPTIEFMASQSQMSIEALQLTIWGLDYQNDGNSKFKIGVTPCRLPLAHKILSKNSSWWESLLHDMRFVVILHAW